MNETLQSEQVGSSKEFREQKRRKRNLSEKQGNLHKQDASTGCSVRNPHIRPQAELSTTNIYAPLRTEMEFEGSKEEANDGEQQGTTNQTGRPPPIILFSATNLLQLKGVLFQLHNPRSVLRGGPA
jgi:hypothetical protein